MKIPARPPSMANILDRKAAPERILRFGEILARGIDLVPNGKYRR